MSRSQKGSIISTEPGYRFQPVNARARSASGCVDDYYMDSGEERASFVCSKPGFVCLAAVLFAVSFISLAFFLETGMPWRNDQQRSSVASNQVAGAGLVVGKPAENDDASITGGKSLRSGSQDASSSDSDSSGDKSSAEAAIRLQEEETVEVHEPTRRRPPGVKTKPLTADSSGTPTAPQEHPVVRPIPSLPVNEENDVMYIFAPFDDRRQSQSRVVRGLMDAQGYGKECAKEFTFHDLIDFTQIRSSSESVEENNFRCADLTEEEFDVMAKHFKNKMRRNSKYLFLVRDPRSLIYTEFDRHGGSLVSCVKNDSFRCLYDEEVLGEAQVTMEKWNNRTQQMIELCQRLGSQSCRLILLERIALELAETLESLGKFLVMDFEKDTFRMLNKMVQKVDEGLVEAATEKERVMVDFLELLLKDTSRSWPWSGRLPYNVFDHLPTWAPLMGKLGYGFSPNVPVLKKDVELADILKQD